MRLTLFVGEPSDSTDAAIRTLRRLVDESAGDFTLEIVNVDEDPERAEQNRVLATPTLIREFPQPVRRLVGDLSRHAELRLALDLSVDLSNAEGLSADGDAAPGP